MTFFPPKLLSKLELFELFRRVGNDLEALRRQAGLELRIVQRGDIGAVELRLDIFRQSLRCGKGLPRIDVDARDARFGQGRCRGQDRRAPLSGYDQHLQFACFDVGRGRIDVNESVVPSHLL